MTESNPFSPDTSGQNTPPESPYAPANGGQYGTANNAGDANTYNGPQYGSGYQPYGAPQYNAQPNGAPQYAAAPGNPSPYADNGQQAPQQPNAPYGGTPYGTGAYQQSPYAPPANGYGNANASANEPPLWMPWYGISFPQAIVRFFKKYATFSGRASRSEYWWTFLFLILVQIAFNLLDAIAGGSGFITTLSGLWSLAVLVPTLAISVRRLHDTDKAGPWLFLPYGLIVAGYIFAIAGGVGVVVSAIHSSYSGAGSSAVAAGLGAILVIAGVIVNIVLMAGASNPAGARFDKPEGGYGPNPFAADQPMTAPGQPVAPNTTAPYQQQGFGGDQSGATNQPYGYGQSQSATGSYDAYGQSSAYGQQPYGQSQPTAGASDFNQTGYGQNGYDQTGYGQNNDSYHGQDPNQQSGNASY